MKLAFLGLLLMVAAAAAADTPPLLAERYETLIRTAGPAGPSSEQYEANRFLVAQGPKGCELLFEALLDTDFSGDTARQIDSFWETSGIPPDLLVKFEAARAARLAKRAASETWALLYAGAYLRTRHQRKRETRLEQLDDHFANVQQCHEQPARALLEVAFLRVLPVANSDFPGHTFPWTAPPQPQTQALKDLLHWWRQHRDEYREKNA